MDLTSKNMYETYKDGIWKALGPLDPDWFEALTSQMFAEGNVSDQDDLCGNQEANFKAPLDKTAVDSQLFSTPKVFRQHRVVSPETEEEQSFTDKETLPWTTTESPCLFQMSKEGIPGANNGGFHQDRFDMLHTPHKYPFSYDKKISESLGAQLHPDMSWTSSLNTPPAVPSTLILSKSDESPCPVSLSADKNVVFVRKLFPSLSNASRVGVVSLKNKDVTTVHQGVGSPEAVQHLESHDSPQSSLNQSDLVWKQTLPDAIEDGEIRRTVAGVLDGAEHVLSIFFTNSSSALRKVKTDRIKRKHSFLTEDGCSSVDVTLTNNAASSDQRTVDQEPGRLPSPPPVKTVDSGITQWSPLSLSELPSYTVNSSCHNNSLAVQVENTISTEQLHHDSDTGQLIVRPRMRHTDSGFTKKKRTFVYTVETPKLQVQGKETECRRMDSSPVPDSGQEVKVKQLKAQDEADRCSVGTNEGKQGNLVDVNLRPSVQPKVQDLDMSQLCKDFEQDFSQMSDPCKLSKVAEDTPGIGFSPSTCLAVKRAKQKAMQANRHHYDGISDRRQVSTAHQNNPINEGTISDSGFQSAVADSANGTAPSFVLPSSEMNGLQLTDKQRATPATSINKGNGKAFLDDILQVSKTDAKWSSAIGESQTLGPGRESELHRESTSAQRPSSAKEAVDNINCLSLNGQACGNLPEKTVSHPSRFTTASNKGIHISSSNLERAKHLFAETEGERTSSDQRTKCAHDTKVERRVSHGSMKNPTTNSNQSFPLSETNEDMRCQLTVSQKADVTELCTLLEEADSQFEFTQFKTEMPKQNCQDNAASPLKVHKELDPEFLSGIDFDDSFSSEAEKHLAAIVKPDKMTSISDGKTNCETTDGTHISTGLSLSSAVKKENSSPEESSTSSKHISEGSSSVMSAEPKNLDGVGHELQNKIPLMLGVGFKTAGGNVLRVSKKCLSKAKALFAGLEENVVTSQTSPDKQSSKTDTKRQFRRSVDNPTNNFLHHKEDHSSFTACGDDTEGQGQAYFSNTNRQVTCIRDGEAAKSLINCKRDTAACQSGFQMASGKGISVSAKAMQEAEALFGDCDAIDSNACKRSIEALSGSVSHEESLPKCEVQGMKVNWSKEPLGEFENVNAGPAARQTEVVQHNEETHNLGFTKTTRTNDAFFRGNPYSPATALSSLSCTSSKNIGSSANHELSNGGGFCSASGNKALMSADALKKGEHLLNELPTPGDANKQHKRKGDALRSVHLCNPIQVSPPKSGGFQTASGKGVAISSTALKKAKMLLIECDEVENTIFVKPTLSEMPVPGPTPRNSGFLAASGKRVAFSSEVLQKAKALFSDIRFNAEIPTVTDTRDSGKTQDEAEVTEKIHCGFTTAGGAKVHVSKKNLLEAKNLLTEFAECHDSNSTIPHDICKSDPSIVKGVKTPCNPTTGGDMDMFSAPWVVENESPQSQSVPRCISIEDQAHADAFSVKEGQMTPAVSGNLHDGLVSRVLDYKIQQTSSREGSKVKRPQMSSVLNFQSLNLSGCTETQQKLFAQEALDCTKALLEDEGLAGQSLSMTLENASHRSVAKRQGTEKRLIEDPDMAGQPPLKRRLLEEFDRTVHGPRSSTLHPEKSCPNGVMKDRRIFKYSVSLHPNITRPHANGKMYVETRLQDTTPTQYSTPEENRSAHSGKPAFVPPFLTNTKTESRRNTMLKDNIRTPSAFVPPFKKQRPFVRESSAKPQVEEKEDKHHHLFVMPFNRNPYVPPTHKKQSTSELTADKSKEDIETVALAHNTNDNLINSKNLPVGCGSEGSAAETSHMEDTLSRSQDIFQNLHNVELARDMQDMRIRKKKRLTIRPFPGSLFLTKSSGATRIPLKAAVNGRPPARYTPKQLYGHGVHQHVCEISSETAESFRFHLKQFIKQEAFLDGGGVQLADGGWLIPSKDGTAGKEEFLRALCDTPGVDPKLISEAWVYNHYRWVVWKQASMERSFPETMGGLCLTPEQVLLQLKYRYDVEVDHSRRPALRKITEKDDTAAKTLVLCVCGVVSRGHSPNRQSFNDTKTPQGADAKVESPSAVVWLTDGWYAIKAQLDEPLTAMLHTGRVAVGGKLIIHGAQLVGSQEACPPLEAPESLMLKICTNSSRPTRWNTKLGFHRDPRPFLLPVSCLYSSGGPVGCVDIIVLRSYPLQWMERKPDAGVVFRSVRAEEKEARRYNCHKQKAMEILFAKIQDAFEKEDKGDNKPQRRRRTVSRQGIASLQAGEELYEAVGDDPAYLEAHLSEQQLETLGTYRRSLMEKRQAELQDRYRRALESAEDSEGSCPKRDVTPVWRLCVADSMDQHGSVYQLNLWRPSSDLQSLLKEGCRYKVYNLTTSDGKKHGGGTAVQLTGSKKTQFQVLQAPQEWLSTRFRPRVSTRTVDLQNPEFQSLCGEVDLTGYVISIVDGQGFSPAFYVADGKLNFVKVRCFSSFVQSGVEELVKPRVLLALSNLQLRGQSTSPTPVVYAGDLTIFSTNPKEGHLQESLSQNKKLVQSQENFFLIAEEKLSHLVRSDGLRSISSPALQARSPAFTTVRRQDTKTTGTPQPLVRSLGSFTPVSRKPPAANCSTEKDRSSMKRRRAQDYLSRIPSPPPLLHLGSEASPCVNKTFNPPRRSGTPSTLNTAQTPARKPVNSPVEDEWVNDEELAMIDTQALHIGDLLHQHKTV